LLLRGLLDLGLTPYLLDRIGDNREPLLAALLRRWSGDPASADGDPLLELIAQVSSDAADHGDRLDDACRLTTHRLLGQQVVVESLRTVTVPHGSEALATIVVDRSGRLLPLGTFAGHADLEEFVVDAGLTVEAELVDAEVRNSVAAALASVSSAGPASDEQSELLLDLLAASSVQAWARWLPGFSTASVSFLLATVVRRPAEIELGPTDLTVMLPPRSHDVVLELAGYLEPFEAAPVLGERRIRFMKGNAHVA
jgi:hypothetical protein